MEMITKELAIDMEDGDGEDADDESGGSDDEGEDAAEAQCHQRQLGAAADAARALNVAKRQRRREAPFQEVQHNAASAGPTGSKTLAPNRIGVPVVCRKLQLTDPDAACMCPRATCANFTAPRPGGGATPAGHLDHWGAEDFVVNTESAALGEWTDSEDDSKWMCESVSNTVDGDGFSVLCKCTTPGIPGKTSRSGNHNRTKFALRYLRLKCMKHVQPAVAS